MPEELYYEDIQYGFKDTLHFVLNTTYKEMKVRLQIVNYLNDNRPLIIHQVSVRDIFKSDELFLNKCLGAGFNPLYKGPQDEDLPELREIKMLPAVKYFEEGNTANSNFIDKNRYLEIGGNKSFMVDLYYWTKDIQYKIICTDYECGNCLETKVVDFEKINSEIELIVDKPDIRDNSHIQYKVKELVSIWN
ncbi:hypothetical protein [Aquiflexum lacus]|uniref:hypothetical protein n=1 Tax=Aquiflexum lacus TaxID=2483805 RepID=UPI0018947340|nr:hypothetical protein [Aquiflexum lacus]